MKVERKIITTIHLNDIELLNIKKALSSADFAKAFRLYAKDELNNATNIIVAFLNINCDGKMP